MRLYTLLLVIAPQLCIGQAPILTGAGATFPYPLYQRWIEVYSAATGRRIIYNPVGSGNGITAFANGETDFGATDSYLSDEEINAYSSRVLHIPTCIGAVAVTYNLPGVSDLKLTPEALAMIFAGQITVWSDRHLTKLNPGVPLPNTDIRVIHRSEESGTTFIFTEFLSTSSETWRKTVGPGRRIRWPVGMGAEGNAGVAGMVKKVPGAVGYVEWNHARQENLPMAALRNRSGAFVKPTAESVSAAGKIMLPADMRIMLTNTPAPRGYPVCGFSYLIVRREQSGNERRLEQAVALQSFLLWIIGEGQQYNSSLFYAPVPDEAARNAVEAIATMTFNGEPLPFPTTGRPETRP